MPTAQSLAPCRARTPRAASTVSRFAYRLSPLCALWMILAVAAAPCLAGVVYEIEVTDHGQSEPKTHQQTITAEGKLISITVKAAGRADDRVIFRGDRGEMLVIDNTDRSFSSLDRAMIEGLASQVSSALEQAQKALENVPEEQRAMLKGLLEANMPAGAQAKPEVVIEKTGVTGSHLDHPTRQVLVHVDGKKRHELWVTPWQEIAYGEPIEDTFLELSEFFRTMMEAISEVNGGVTPRIAGAEDNVFEYMIQLEGFPVVSRSFGDDGELTGESSLRSSKRMTLDADAFEPPAGYKRRQMFLDR